jgi:tetratricopeptide (TPR) repeat protein
VRIKARWFSGRWPLVSSLESVTRVMKKALKANGQSAEAHFRRGNLFTALGQLAAALASFDRAIAIREDFSEAHFNWGVVLKDLNQPWAALASYDRAIAINLAFAAAHFRPARHWRTSFRTE